MNKPRKTRKVEILSLFFTEDYCRLGETQLRSYTQGSRKIVVVEVLLLASPTYPSVIFFHLREMEAPNSEDYTLYEGKTESAVTDDLQARILET